MSVTVPQVMGALQGMGYSPAGAAAITGNLMQESGLNPGIGQHGTDQTAANLGSGAGGYGLAQWTAPSRQAGLEQYASAHHAPVQSLNAQLGYLNQELHSSHPALATALEHPGNVGNLTTQFEKQYEAAGIPDLGQRLSYAQRAYGLGAGSKPPTTYSLPQAKGNIAPTEPHNNLASALQTAFSSLHEQGGGSALASQLETALNHRAQVGHIEPGVTQQLPSEHLVSLAQTGTADPSNLAVAGALAISHDPRLGAFTRLVKSADNVNASHYNYEWGGGHNPAFAPTTGSGHGSGSGVGYDCSGVLSHILHMAGVLNQPLVSGQFAQLNRYIPQAKPGVGHGPHTITIYANAVHTFANIGGTYFGTSGTNPGGGAGWIGSTTENNNADYTAWHLDF